MINNPDYPTDETQQSTKSSKVSEGSTKSVEDEWSKYLDQGLIRIGGQAEVR